MYKKANRIISYMAVIAVILSIIITGLFYFNYYNMNNKYESLKSNYSSQKESSDFTLINPTYDESISFMRDDDSLFINSTISNAKIKGLRCALTNIQVIYRYRLTTYEIIGFETSDRGMVYFEFDTDYEVFPELGKKYIHCIFDENGENPYASYFDDTIIDIIEIW